MKKIIHALALFIGCLITALLIVVLVILMVFGMYKAQRRAAELKYNNGICPVCGGQYVYSQAIVHRSRTGYIYICDECGHLIELDQYIDGGQ